jgi:hypothetical protein
MLPTKLISGGQTGADRAGLDFALAQGIPCGGWCPFGRKADDGPVPMRYPLKETWGDSGYARRTGLNVRDSDATLIFNRGPMSPGCALTLQNCRRLERPFHVVPVAAGAKVSDAVVAVEARKVAEFLACHRPAVLNIAGNREFRSPGVGAFTKRVLEEAWAMFAEVALTVEPARRSQDDFLGCLPPGGCPLRQKGGLPDARWPMGNEPALPGGFRVQGKTSAMKR